MLWKGVLLHGCSTAACDLLLRCWSGPWHFLRCYQRCFNFVLPLAAVLCTLRMALRFREAGASPDYVQLAADVAVTSYYAVGVGLGFFLRCFRRCFNFVLPLAAVMCIMRRALLYWEAGASLEYIQLAAVAAVTFYYAVGVGLGFFLQCYRSCFNFMLPLAAVMCILPLALHFWEAGASPDYAQLAAGAAVTFLSCLDVGLLPVSLGNSLPVDAKLAALAAGNVTHVFFNFPPAMELANDLSLGASAPHPPTMELAVESYGGS